MAVNFRYAGGEASATTTTNVVAYLCPANRKALVSFTMMVHADAAAGLVFVTKNGTSVGVNGAKALNGQVRPIHGLMFLDAGDSIGIKQRSAEDAAYLVVSVIEREGQPA